MFKAGKFKLAVPIVILAIGVAIAAGLVFTKPAPGEVDGDHQHRLVRTLRATPTSHRIAIKAFGTSRASQEWTAIAEITGRITMIDDRFEEGDVIQSATLLATIDKLDYQLAAKSAQTDVSLQQQKLLELSQSRTNLDTKIKSVAQQAAISKAELDRMQQLLGRRAGSQAEFDRASSSHLESEMAVRDLTNELEILGIQKVTLEFALEAAQLRLTQVERDIERCEIRLPFSALCVARSCELHQRVTASQPLGTFIALDKAEVVAMVEARRVMALIPKFRDTFGVIDLTTQTTSLLKELRRQFSEADFPVDIAWRAGENESQWRGRLVRISPSVDETTRAIPVIVEVDDAFTAVQLGVTPAMVPGMFLELLIYGDQVEDVFVIPRSAMRDGKVFVVRDGKLAIVPVNVMMLEEESAIIDTGLTDGDQVVIADLFPVAEGMPLRYEEVPNPVKPRLEIPQLHTSPNVSDRVEQHPEP